MYFYNNTKAIYTLFNAKEDIANYLLNDYKYIIEDINTESILNETEIWEQTLHEALKKLGNHISNTYLHN